MREKCPRCGHVFSTTGDPSANTGFFLDDAEVEKYDGGEVCSALFRQDYKFRRAILCPKCKGLSLEGEESGPKTFPLQAELRSSDVKTGPRRIPWEIAEIAYRKYSRRYGTSQSLERLAERGGFGWREMDEFYPEWRDRTDIFLTLCEESRILRENFEQAQQKWRAYEQDYILPTFVWAKELGIKLVKLVADNAGKNCVELFFDALRARIEKLEEERELTKDGRVDRLIAELGGAFRGLWKSTRFEEYTEKVQGWTVTFIFGGEYVETPEERSAVTALEWAVWKLAQPETIVASAIYDGVHTLKGESHAAIIKAEAEKGFRLGSEGQGFVTDRGRFVDRKEAAAIAFTVSQIPEPKEELFSEDLKK